MYFRTATPETSSISSDETFSAEEWKGKRLNCPWNGRSWSMANSHVVGVQPGKEAIDPLDMDIEWIECTNLPRPGGTMSVSIRGGRTTVEIC